MKYLSLFSGIGGFELGIDKAWQHQGQGRPRSLQRVLRQGDMAHLSGQSPNRPICIGYSEIDKYAIKVYERQFNGIDSRPAGQNKKETEVVENSSNTESEHARQLAINNRGHYNYGDCTTINAGELPDFDLLVGGFPCQAFSVAGKRAGFNDTRGTLFFDIARILKEKRPRHLVLENVKGLLSHDSGRTFTTILGVLTDLGYLVEWQVLNSKDFGVPQNRERIYIIGHLGGECSGEVLPITGNGKKDSGQGKPVFSTVRATYPGNWNGDYIDTDTEYRQEESKFESARIRRLIPLECERLQGFPDEFTKYDQEGNEISDTQRYKMCGNAVTVNVVEAVITNLMGCLTAPTKDLPLDIKGENK